jgi:hypothetical protein
VLVRHRRTLKSRKIQSSLASAPPHLVSMQHNDRGIFRSSSSPPPRLITRGRCQRYDQHRPGLVFRAVRALKWWVWRDGDAENLSMHAALAKLDRDTLKRRPPSERFYLSFASARGNFTTRPAFLVNGRRRRISAASSCRVNGLASLGMLFNAPGSVSA